MVRTDNNPIKNTNILSVELRLNIEKLYCMCFKSVVFSGNSVLFIRPQVGGFPINCLLRAYVNIAFGWILGDQEVFLVHNTRYYKQTNCFLFSSMLR